MGGGLAGDTTIKETIGKILRDHPALLVSGFYVAASFIGMFYSWTYLRHFGVNIFNYAQISDFLLASLKEPFTWGLVVLAVLLVAFDNAMSRRVQSRSPGVLGRWYGSPRYRQVNYFVAIGMIGLFIFIYARMQARDTLAGEGRWVDVIFADHGAAVTSMLLGTTGQFVILFDPGNERVDIHPVENIRSISFEIPEK